MALSDKKILEEMERGNVMISPFRRENLSTSSYDLTLGEHYFREQEPTNGHNIYNIYSKSHVDQVWNTTYCTAEPAEKVFAKYDHYEFDHAGIDPDARIIILEPGETVLAHTEEFIGGRNTITTMMKARSSLGRSFIEVCKCAGWGDVGYVNRWTMEVTNNSRRYAIPLVVGRRVAQMVFFYVGETLQKSYARGGKYQASDDMEMLQREWRPEMMLPRLYNDREVTRARA